MKRIVLTILLCLVVAGCGSDDTTIPEDAPENHTVVEDGVAHASGLKDPENNCVGCHGNDLGGGDDDEPSCFSCHGRKW